MKKRLLTLSAIAFLLCISFTGLAQNNLYITLGANYSKFFGKSNLSAPGAKFQIGYHARANQFYNIGFSYTPNAAGTISTKAYDNNIGDFTDADAKIKGSLSQISVTYNYLFNDVEENSLSPYLLFGADYSLYKWKKFDFVDDAYKNSNPDVSKLGKSITTSIILGGGVQHKLTQSLFVFGEVAAGIPIQTNAGEIEYFEPLSTKANLHVGLLLAFGNKDY